MGSTRKTRGEAGRDWLPKGEGKLKQGSYFRGQSTARQNRIEPSRAGAFGSARRKKLNSKTQMFLELDVVSQ